MTTSTFTVAEIHCANCENTIRTALSRMAGVNAVVPSSATNDVKVSFDPDQVSDADIRAKLDEIGYPPLS